MLVLLAVSLRDPDRCGINLGADEFGTDASLASEWACMTCQDLRNNPDATALDALTKDDGAITIDAATLGTQCGMSALTLHARICTCDWYETCGGGSNTEVCFLGLCAGARTCGTPCPSRFCRALAQIERSAFHSDGLYAHARVLLYVVSIGYYYAGAAALVIGARRSTRTRSTWPRSTSRCRAAAAG